MEEKSKPRAKNYSSEEINCLVDLVQEKKSQLFGSLSASFTFEEKNKVWDDLASRLSALHGTVRNRDDVIKKWSNLLSKHKPLIADKIASRNKTGGGPPGCALTPLEDKIKSIKGKQVFEGIASGVDITIEPTHSQVSFDSDQMVMNPLLSTDDEQPKLAGLPSRKRKFSYPLSDATRDMQLTDTKQILLEKEEEKLAVVKRIESSLERIESHMKRIGDMLQILPEIVANQKVITALTQPHMYPQARSYTPPSYPKSFPSGGAPPFYPPSSGDY